MHALQSQKPMRKCSLFVEPWVLLCLMNVSYGASSVLHYDEPPIHPISPPVRNKLILWHISIVQFGPIHESSYIFEVWEMLDRSTLSMYHISANMKLISTICELFCTKSSTLILRKRDVHTIQSPAENWKTAMGHYKPRWVLRATSCCTHLLRNASFLNPQQRPNSILGYKGTFRFCWKFAFQLLSHEVWNLSLRINISRILSLAPPPYPAPITSSYLLFFLLCALSFPFITYSPSYCPKHITSNFLTELTSSPKLDGPYHASLISPPFSAWSQCDLKNWWPHWCLSRGQNCSAWYYEAFTKNCPCVVLNMWFFKTSSGARASYWPKMSRSCTSRANVWNRQRLSRVSQSISQKLRISNPELCFNNWHFVASQRKQVWNLHDVLTRFRLALIEQPSVTICAPCRGALICEKFAHHCEV